MDILSKATPRSAGAFQHAPARRSTVPSRLGWQATGWFAFASLVGLVGLSGCEPVDRHATFEKRGPTYIGKPDAVVGPVTSSQRFDAEPKEGGSPHGHGGAHGGGPGGGPGVEAFVFEAPESWERKERTSMRLLNFSIQGREDAYCFLSAMEGTQDKVLFNANRWRRQLGLEAWTQAELDAAETGMLFGAPAIRVHWEGDFDDGMGNPAIPGAAMVGLIAHHQSSLVFLKMVGPKDVIDQEVAGFDRFAETLDFPVGANAGQPQNKLSYEAPADWVKQAPRQMRDLGFDVGDCDLSISFLQGDGGGLLMNVNRWRGQFGLGNMQANELSELDTIEILGGRGHWLSLEGPYKGMTNQVQEADGALEGAIVPLGSQTLFVKLTGPKDQVQAEAQNLREFTATLRLEGQQ